MGKTITLVIPEGEARSFEAALDELLAVLGKFDEPEARERDEEMLRLQAETRLLIDQINRRLHVEKVL